MIDPERSLFVEEDDPLLGRYAMPQHGAYEVDKSYLTNNPFELSVYRIEDDRITIQDAVWGKCIIGEQPGDEVLLELGAHPVLQRLQSIEQLTLPKEMTTIAGTDNFSRWEHVWGSVVLVRKLSEELNIEPRDQRVLELRALLSDSSQWAFSHLGDWMFQGIGSTEDAHDDQQKEFLIKTGVGEVLERHGYTLDEVLVKGDEQDWVECSSPDLCVDRVDFGAREMMRWINRTPELHVSIKNRPFFVDDQNRLVMNSIEDAKIFTKAFLLLATEHWQEPVHRLQLKLLENIVKFSMIYEEPMFMNSFLSTDRYHPRDYLMSVDHDFEAVMHMAHSLPWILQEISSDIGRSKRLTHRTVRSNELESFLAIDKPLPDPLQATNWQGRHHPLTPPNVELLRVESPEDLEDFGNNAHYVDVFLPPLKPRFIDPLFKDKDGAVKRLSDADAYTANLIEQQKSILGRAYVARLMVNSEYRKHLVAGLAEVEASWPQLLELPRMSDDVFQAAFRDAVMFAIAYRKTLVEWRR